MACPRPVSIKSVKVCDSSAQGNCPTTAVINGLNWIIGDHTSSNIAVANLSVGDAIVPSEDTWAQNAIDAGITVVAAAGNKNTNVSNSSPEVRRLAALRGFPR